MGGIQDWLVICFDPHELEGLAETLAKLKQTSSFLGYLATFEELSSQVKGLPEKVSINCFISGLREEIQANVKVAKPSNFHDIIKIARLHEDKYLAKRKAHRSEVSKGILLTPANVPKFPNPCYQRLTYTELKERRKKGLCFSCDEKYAPNHVCKNKKIFYIQTIEEEELDDEEPNTHYKQLRPMGATL